VGGAGRPANSTEAEYLMFAAHTDTNYKLQKKIATACYILMLKFDFKNSLVDGFFNTI